MHLGLRQFPKAEKAFRKGIALAPNWLYPLANLAGYFTNQAQYDTALYYYRKALKIDSNYHTTYTGIGWMYVNKGNLDSAIFYYKKGLEKDPQDPITWTWLGWAYYFKKDWKNALLGFYQGIKYDSTYNYAYEGALKVHLYTTINKDSINYYVTKMILIDKTNPVVYKELGDIYEEFQMHQEALNMYSLSIQFDSLNTLTWIGASDAFHHLGKDTMALRCCQKAWRIDSTDAVIANQLGVSYFHLNQFPEALDMTAKAILLKPEEPLYYYNYGYISLMNKDTLAAEKYYRKALEKNTRYAAVYYSWAQLKATMGRNKEAVELLQKAVQYGNYARTGIENDPAFIKLKLYPSFKTLMAKMKK